MKYNRKKHCKSNWMTKGILNSINTKNALYKILIQTNSTTEDVLSRLKSEYGSWGILLMPSTIISLTSDASFQIKFDLLIIIVTIYIELRNFIQHNTAKLLFTRLHKI